MKISFVLEVLQNEHQKKDIMKKRVKFFSSRNFWYLLYLPWHWFHFILEKKDDQNITARKKLLHQNTRICLDLSIINQLILSFSTKTWAAWWMFVQLLTHPCFAFVMTKWKVFCYMYGSTVMRFTTLTWKF